ncbi:hypothetical protein LR48_Vigan10g184200 [Vigna angularis]|uniref:Uncharacterized protein n=1 Tax=Phaseolus angularis TaxID=3914 RepID=A0A0L9VLQ0_PHAAN|nr:hypothetical protein LR48_Vigan10g184200 [Vigna angularis]
MQAAPIRKRSPARTTVASFSSTVAVFAHDAGSVLVQDVWTRSCGARQRREELAPNRRERKVTLELVAFWLGEHSGGAVAGSEKAVTRWSSSLRWLVWSAVVNRKKTWPLSGRGELSLLIRGGDSRSLMCWVQTKMRKLLEPLMLLIWVKKPWA